MVKNAWHNAKQNKIYLLFFYIIIMKNEVAADSHTLRITTIIEGENMMKNSPDLLNHGEVLQGH